LFLISLLFQFDFAPRKNRMGMEMATLIAQLAQNPQLAAALAAVGVNNNPELGPPAGRPVAPAAGQVAAAAGQMAPAEGQDAGGEAESDDEAEEERDQILRASLAACRKDEAKKEMMMLIKNGIKHGLWRRIKVIENKDVRKQAALMLLEILNFRSMQGDSVEATQTKEQWLATCEKHICRILNEQRGHQQQRVKTLMEGFWGKNGKLLPRKDVLVALIKRDFALQGGALAQSDYEILKFWFTEVLPIVAGNQTDWQAEHHGCMTVSEGHCPNEPNKLCVPESTEAMAVWIMENNLTCWPAQWTAKDELGDKPIKRLAKNADGTDVTLANSRVSGAICNCFVLFAPSDA